jgi:hypothetical protein
MTRLTWLPGVLRAAGLTVHEQPGWQTRGYEPYDPYGLIVHATAGKLSIESDIRVLLTGSATAPPPISQLFLARTGEWWVIASGRCNHALTGKAGLLKGYGNTRLIGIEAANDNRGEPWPDVQYLSYIRGVAAICRHLGWEPTRRVAGHKEHQPGDKSDPTFNMDAFRTRVVQTLANPSGDDMYEQYDRDRLASTWEHAVAVNEKVDKLAAEVAELKARPAGTLELSAAAVEALGPVVEAAVRKVLADAGAAGD